jgi:hypothetical protein
MISATLVKTWLFLIESKDPQLAKQRNCAYKNIRKLFGSTDIAELYIEQDKDHDIEVVII